jgi:hypothetical protein
MHCAMSWYVFNQEAAVLCSNEPPPSEPHLNTRYHIGR